MSFLGILIFMLLIISVAEMIYYGAPIRDILNHENDDKNVSPKNWVILEKFNVVSN